LKSLPLVSQAPTCEAVSPVVELADGATDMNVVLVGHTDACDDQKTARAA